MQVELTDTQLFLAISAIGFGIQQFLQVVMDPMISATISVLKNRQPIHPIEKVRLLPGGISDVDAKKALLGLSSFVLGLIIVSGSKNLLVLDALGLTELGAVDLFVSALIISAGTEGANSVLKLVQYSKDAVKAQTQPSVKQNSPVPQQPALSVEGEEDRADVPADPELDRTPNARDDEAADLEDGEGEAADEHAERERGEGMFALTETSGWRAAKCLLKLRAQVNQIAPNRRKTFDGLIGDAAHASRTSDHNPWVRDGNVGVVTAIDITHDPTHGCDADAIAEAIRATRDKRVKYIIWNRRIASSTPKGDKPAWAWRPYSGENPHTKHVHISVHSQKAAYDSTDSWAI